MAQQTALDIYRAKLISTSLHDIRKFFAKEHIYAEQAKQIEKQQIEKAFSDGQELSINNPLLPHYSSKEYYKDTYENNK